MDEAGRNFCTISKGDIVIIGFPKSGTVSLQKYLEKEYPDKTVHRRELIYLKSGPEEIRRKYEECKIYIITRTPIDRIWSMFNYYDWIPDDFISWVGQERIIDSTGTSNPIESCNYEKYIKNYKQFNPKIVKLEKMKEVIGFTRENITKSKREMPEAFKVVTEELLRSRL